VYEVLIDFLACDNKALGRLTVAQLKQLLTVLKELAEMELLALDDRDNEKDKLLAKELKDWINKLTEAQKALANLGENDKEKARLAVEAVKIYLYDNLPEVKKILLLLFSEKLRVRLQEFAKKYDKVAFVLFVKFLVETDLFIILAKKIGVKAAKRLFPFLGPAITIYETIGVLGLLDALDDITKKIDELFEKLVRELAKTREPNWPNHFMGGQGFELMPPTYQVGSKVRISMFLVCGSMVGNKIVFGKPCPIKFGKKKEHSQEFTLTEDMKSGKSFKIPGGVGIDTKSVEGALPCLNGAVLCYTYLHLERQVDKKYISSGTRIIGAKVFKK
jgi:hypothetical protein